MSNSSGAARGQRNEKKAHRLGGRAKLPRAADPNSRVRLAMAGEHQTHLARISTGRNEFGAASPVHLGRVIREPKNPHDPGALMVKVGMARVGYVPRSDQERVNALMGDSAKATCVVWVTGGWDRGGGDVGHFGCEIDIA